MSGKKMQTILLVVALFLIAILFLVVVKNFSGTPSVEKTTLEIEEGEIASPDTSIFSARNFISGTATVIEDTLVDFDLDGRAEHFIVYEDIILPEDTKKQYSHVLVGNIGDGWNRIETPIIQADKISTKKFISTDSTPALLVEFNKDDIFSWSIFSYNGTAFSIFPSESLRNQVLIERGYDLNGERELFITPDSIVEMIPQKTTSQFTLSEISIIYEFSGDGLKILSIDEKK